MFFLSEEAAEKIRPDEDEHDPDDDHDDDNIYIFDDVRRPVLGGGGFLGDGVNLAFGKAAAGAGMALSAGPGEIVRID
jgi:hypothetical protein